MQIYYHIDEWRQIRRELPHHLSLGFVPTMGNLHRGHASLFATSQQENDCTLVSIFVNPTQFNADSDYQYYPRTIEADLELLQQEGVDFCLIPDPKAIYPDNYRYQLLESQQSLVLEGAHRPGHFNGVLTVVAKLFNLVQPHRSYFGEKDYQQCQLIQEMTKALLFDLEIRICPTIREASGLAFSSRNHRLNSAQQKLAEQFAQLFHQSHKTCEEIIQKLHHLGIHVDYVEEEHGRRFAAVSIGEIRLIDNYETAHPPQRITS